MAYLSQASSPVADFDKFVISFLQRVPQATLDTIGAAGGIEFGQTTDGPSLIYFDTTRVNVDFYSAHGAYTVTAGGLASDPLTAVAHVSAPLAAPGNTWHRVIISGDFSGGAEFISTGPGLYTATNAFRIWISVDDTDFSPTTYRDYANVEHSGPSGVMQPTTRGDIGISYTDVNQSYPGFTIAIGGLEFGIPCLAANAGPTYNGVFEMADFMMWTGVSLNTSVTGNRRLFIDASGNPVNPSVAIAALGTPKYDIRGPASGIATNLGSAGSLTKVGTVTDYTPGP